MLLWRGRRTYAIVLRRSLFRPRDNVWPPLPGAGMVLHILKLCVGIDDIDQIRTVQRRRLAAQGHLRHFTRHRPRRAAEVLDGGSIYWIIKGFVQVRQRIVAIDHVTEASNGKHCAFVFDPELVATVWQPRRPHQGWRYLAPDQAPADLPANASGTDLPPHIAADLRELGLL